MAKGKKSDPTERAARKAVPRSIDAWTKEVAGCLTFAMKRPTMLEACGQAWLDSMQEYYIERVAILAKNIPPGMNKALAHRHLTTVKNTLR